jgi:hypothetical protein
MGVYHLYKVVDFNRDGPAIEVEANSDDEAIRKSQQYIDGADLLLWHGSRFVITLKRKQE